jgi:hypothetical protein
LLAGVTTSLSSMVNLYEAGVWPEDLLTVSSFVYVVICSFLPSAA